jgi:hypothetical protein
MKSKIVNAILLTGLGLMLAVQEGQAQNPNIGTAGAKFLRIPVGARASAMGGACVASINDPSALFWNPAGIVGVPSTGLIVSHTPWWATTKLNSVAIVASMENVGSIGVSATILSMDKMEVTTEQQPEGTGQTFDAGDLMIGVTYARRLTEDFSVGITAKYINQRIWNESANGWAFDIGTQYHIGFRDLTLAMSMTNFGPDMTFDGRDLSIKYDANSNTPENRLTPARLAPEEFPLPLHFQVGVSMTALSTDDFNLLLAADVTHPSDNRERVHVGAEIGIFKQFYLRGGYRFNYDEESVTFGAGVSVPLGETAITFDYAYALYDLLPNINRFTVGLAF